jgi:hypothetical protein
MAGNHSILRSKRKRGEKYLKRRTIKLFLIAVCLALQKEWENTKKRGPAKPGLS